GAAGTRRPRRARAAVAARAAGVQACGSLRCACARIGGMDYVVVGAGAIGGTVGARLSRDGHDVLLCDADREHVEAINASGLAIEGPVEEFTARAPAVLPEELPGRLDVVLLAVTAQPREA